MMPGPDGDPLGVEDRADIVGVGLLHNETDDAGFVLSGTYEADAGNLAEQTRGGNREGADEEHPDEEPLVLRRFAAVRCLGHVLRRGGAVTLGMEVHCCGRQVVVGYRQITDISHSDCDERPEPVSLPPPCGGAPPPPSAGAVSPPWA